MNKRRNKITIFIVAALMFTSTWAGVFAADPEQPTDTDPAVTGQDVDNQNVADPAPAGNGQDAEITSKSDDEITVEVPTVTRNGMRVTVAWKAVEGDSVTYAVIEKFNGQEVETPVYEGNAVTCTLDKEVGKYMYKVVATVGENTYESDYSAEVEIVEPPAAVTGIRALSGNYSVQLKWKYEGEADGFIIYRYKSASDFNNNVNGKRIDPNGSSYLTGPDNKGEYTWTNSVDVALMQTYWYKVVAAKKTGSDFSVANVVESEPAVIRDKGCVRPMYITLKLKKKRTLKSLNGGPKITLKKNTVVTATGFGGGCYYFTYNGKRYRMARTSAKKQVALYNGRGNWDYSPEEAELFVKQAGLSSKTNYLIWTSFYTQHMYLMHWDSGVKAWKCIDHWDCATGKASTPSPTGDKAIGKKKKKHHNIKWWSSFSNPKSIANSIHGKKKGWKLGLPQSHGCIRNEVANAYKVYTMCPKNTKVYNY